MKNLEQSIVSLIKKRDDSGMEALLKHYSPLIRYVVSPILNNAHDIEECLYEAAMKAWNGIAQYDEKKGSFKAWLTAISRNSAINYARRADHGEKTELDERLASSEPTPDELAEKRAALRSLKRELENLPFSDAQLFYRKYYYLQPVSQIAREMGLSERAVEGRLYRLKKKLKTKLGGEL